MRADLKRLRRDTDSGRISSSSLAESQTAISTPAQPTAGRLGSSAVGALQARSPKTYSIAAVSALVLIVAITYGAYHFGSGSRGAAPAKITQISHWDRPIYLPRLSPDGHTVAFTSPVNGIPQLEDRTMGSRSSFSSTFLERFAPKK